MARQLDGKVALVTGGSVGIGLATALLFAQEGARVVIASRRAEEGEKAVRMIKDAGGEAIFIKTDISKAAEVEALIKQAIASYGRLDCAVNNAGVDGDKVLTADYTEEGWDRVTSILLRGVWLCMKYEIPQMLKQGGGSIVNTASIFSLVGGGDAAYVTSKHGVAGLTKVAALEYATAGIRVNVLCPGIIHTQMLDDFQKTTGEAVEVTNARQPMGRVGKPEEIAAAALWLCLDTSAFVTGTSIVADGGYTTR